MSDFERRAIQRVIAQARAAGVDVPPEIVDLLGCRAGSAGARAWADAHPDDDRVPCCCASTHDPPGCTCWVPVYDVDQAPPRRPGRPEDIQARPAMCGDCAYRKGSPERHAAWQEEALLALAAEGEPFWCHDGMRRPTRWEHPDGRIVPGHPDDWQPQGINGIPFRADGSGAYLCAGWAARVTRAGSNPMASTAVASRVDELADVPQGTPT